MFQLEYRTRAYKLQRWDCIKLGQDIFVVFAMEPFTGSTVEVHLCRPERLDVIVTTELMFNEDYVDIYLPTE